MKAPTVLADGVVIMISRAYRLAFAFAILFHLAHLISLPILITYDGHLYVDLADVLGTNRFPRDWDFLRTPLFPLALKLSFWLFGKQPLAVIGLQSIFGFLGIWSLSATIKRLGHPLVAAASMVLLTLHPTVVAYEHSLLSEIGTFFFLSLTLNLLLWKPTHSPVLKTVSLVFVLTAGYYYRPTILYLSPLLAVLYGLSLLLPVKSFRELPRWRAARKMYISVALHACAVLIFPFLAAHPWQQQLDKTNRKGGQLVLFLIKQAVIPQSDPIWGGSALVYEEAITASKVNGRLPVGGLRNDLWFPVFNTVHQHAKDGQNIWVFRHFSG